MATQVKLYVEPEGECRRFPLEPTTNFASLQQRIQQLVGRDNFRLFWQDWEGDHIVLGSDDELKAAQQTIAEGAPLRLYLRPTNQSNSPTGEKKVHGHVTCDGCQGQVAGTRYKCLECPDFDLCKGCETKGEHQEHNMVVIRSPAHSDWKKCFGHGHGPRPDSRRGPCGMNRAWGPPRGFGPRGPGCPPGPGPFHGPFPGFIPPFLRQFAPLIDSTVEMDVNLDRPFPEVMAEVTNKVMEAIAKARSEAEAQVVPEEKANGDQGNTEVTTPVEKVEVAQATPTVVAPVVTQVAETVREPVESLTPSEVENGWTDLKSEPVEGEAVKTEEKTTETTAPNQEENRIESALRAMEEMGFPTEGTLLRRLLQNYNGDISRVLDSIK